ncbi:MAG: BACON domain-containing protein, partial [Rhodanobacteraceae bacterium]
RVRIACVENIFFDVSDVNFNIAAIGDPDPTGAIASISPLSFSFTLDANTTGSDTLTVSNGGDVGTTLNYTISESEDACATTTDVAWLNASPTGGAIGGGASAPVTVDVDTATLSEGSHSASLCVGTDDPLHAQFVVPVDVTVNPSAPDEIFKDGFDGDGGGECAPMQLLQDPSFEATDPNDFTNPNWDSFDSIAGTPFCDATCDDGGTVVARTGTWFVWFGGWDQLNTSWLSQSVVFPSGQPRWLNYWLDNQISGDPTAALTLSIDGTPVLTFPTDGGTGEYAAQTFEIPALYLDGQSHALRFDWEADSPAGEVGGAIIDDVTLDCEAQPTGRPGGSRGLNGASRKVLR